MRPSSLPSLVTTGGGHEVAVLEQLRDFARRRFRRDAFDARVHHFADGLLRVLGEQPGDVQAAEILVVPIDDEQAVGAVGQLAAHAQVAQHDFERDVRRAR